MQRQKMEFGFWRFDMTVFTYSQARQKFSTVLDIARREGSAQIRRRDGSLFSILPLRRPKRSPFQIKGVKTRATTTDILEAVRESRSR
jgi:hypothetical protein